MKIYTKAGDQGRTSLLGGKQVMKDDPLLEAYGTLDELISYLGLLGDLVKESALRKQLQMIQDHLMKSAALLATGNAREKLNELPEVTQEDILFLERSIDEMSSILPPLKHFILPGGDPVASHCHIARTICRRAERKVVLTKPGHPRLKRVLKYLNRLSDFLFILARWITKKNGSIETHWKSTT